LVVVVGADLLHLVVANVTLLVEAVELHKKHIQVYLLLEGFLMHTL
jgi:hypothetical protein